MLLIALYVILSTIVVLGIIGTIAVIKLIITLLDKLGEL
jgi:hypothetical protein